MDVAVMGNRLIQFQVVAVFCLFIVYVVTAAADTEIQYVGDTLHVGVRATPDHTQPSIAVLVTGTAVEVLDKQQDYLHVRTRSGLEGWVKSSYLSKSKPAKLLLEGLRKDKQTLQAELEHLHSENAVAHDSDMAVRAMQANEELLTEEIRDLHQRVNVRTISGKHDWIYWFVALLVAAGLGFVTGLLWCRGRIRKKLGGLTI